MKVRKLHQDDIDEVVDVHISAFPGFFLSFLGPRFLKEFCKSFVYDEQGIGVVAMAQANGRAVIASRVGGLPEQIVDGKTGILVPPNDVKCLAFAILNLLGDPAKVLSMGKEASIEYQRKYSWAIIASKTVEVYKEAIKRFEREQTMIQKKSNIRLLYTAYKTWKMEKYAN